MAKDPAFLFYYQDFLVGTSFMTLEETGAYVKLLCFQAAKGHLSEADILKKIPTPTWEAICSHFIKDKKGFFNERLEQEIEKRRLFTESRRKNLHMDNHMAKHMKGAMTPHMENENENKDIIKDTKEVIKGKIPPAIEDVIAYCKERNKGVDPYKWFNHYEAKGWLIGKNPMKNWKAAIHTWEGQGVPVCPICKGKGLIERDNGYGAKIIASCECVKRIN